METFGKIYQFGKKIGADLSFDGMRYCRLNLADGGELKFYGDGKIVVGDYEWTPPEIMLESIGADLKHARKRGLESDPKGLLEHLKTTERLVQEYIEEVEEILAAPQRWELKDVICTIESTFEELTEDERATIQPHYEALHKHCYGGGRIDSELVQRELKTIWDEIGSTAEWMVEIRYRQDHERLQEVRQLAGLEE